MRPVRNPMTLVSRNLLTQLMTRTGDGQPITVRDLARAAGVHPSKIGQLRTGRRHTASQSEAEAIAERLGVDLLVLWAHTGRSAQAPQQVERVAIPV